MMLGDDDDDDDGFHGVQHCISKGLISQIAV